MHTGKINKLIRDRGFGFIDDTDGRKVFFHQSSLVGITFDVLKGDEKVEFEVESSPKGPRAVNVSIAK
jgi:CspA family cold shock protein